MTNGLIVTIIFLIGLTLAFLAGYASAKKDTDCLLVMERHSHEDALAKVEERYLRELMDARKNLTLVSQENAKRHTKILDEISQVTGINEVTLPSFGTIYLNHTDNVRKAMQALHMEDLSDGALD